MTDEAQPRYMDGLIEGLNDPIVFTVVVVEAGVSRHIVEDAWRIKLRTFARFRHGWQHFDVKPDDIGRIPCFSQ